MHGITNCDTVRKARRWLEANGVSYEFWDYKKVGIDRYHLELWCEEFGWDKVLNMRGRMWKSAAEADRAQVVDRDSAIDFMVQLPTAIKRPVMESPKGLLLGFEEGAYAEMFE